MEPEIVLPTKEEKNVLVKAGKILAEILRDQKKGGSKLREMAARIRSRAEARGEKFPHA